MSIKKIIRILKKNKRFLVSTHVNPDPDALCSELAMAGFLRSLGKTVHIVNEEKLPERYSFFPGAGNIKPFVEKFSFPFEVAVILDCGDLERIGRVKSLLRQDHCIINIDHHLTNDKFGRLNLVDVEASSTAEVLFDLFKAARYHIPKPVAVNLYAGIMTDTGSFSFENTTYKTHQIAGELRKNSFSAYALYRRLYEMIPLVDLQVLLKVLSGFKALHRGKVVCVELKKDILSKFSEGFDLRDTIFKLLRLTKEIEIIAILTEVSAQKTRINLRSIGQVNVAKISHQFAGGGHRRASGCMIGKNIKESRLLIERSILKELA